ncbi:BRO family protein [Brachybacterium huguangmaarense]|uniref:BRO family protein n=1 Tax=Brachybacterium huguangmaarense TaxID=1652028 RepID=A0ABY6FXZ5_9MICO|nr:BRO family protein [Brachybacterium huguangmaarense]UYG15798.1 BRO family protein [Brachybacterium huguangmaarense]
MPFTYEGMPVRTVDVDGEVWFVASDVARVLDLGRTHDAVRGLDDDEKGAESIRTPGGEQLTTIVSEPGLYQLVMRSRKPEAKPFRRWIAHEVIPAIRRTGQYGAARELTGPELMARALIEADVTIKQQAAELEAARPKVEVAERLLDATTDLSVQDAANALTRAGFRIGRTRLFSLLRDIGWTFRGPDGAWRPYAHHIEAGRLSVLPSSHYHPRTGELVLDPPQVRVTPKGLAQLMRDHGPHQPELAVQLTEGALS